MDQPKHALLLLAVDPMLKGILIAGGPGTAKSLLARSFPSLFAPSHRRPPFIEAPLSISEDRLLGALDLEGTLRTGKREIAEGLLAKVSGGALFVDEINLLASDIAHQIAGALDAGGQLFPSFVLAGTYDAAEGEVAAALIDRVGLHVAAGGRLPIHQRVEILNRVAAFQRDPHAFVKLHAAETASLQERVAAARDLLPAVRLKGEDVRTLSRAALRLGLESHRADIFAVRAALAHAALMGRSAVSGEDLKAAVELVLLPRAAPLQRDGSSELLAEPAPSAGASTMPQCPPGAAGGGTTPVAQDVEDLIAQALDAMAPGDILDPPPAHPPGKSAGRAGRRRRGSRETVSPGGGRYVRALTRKPSPGKIAADATLRAAAPLQMLRRLSQDPLSSGAGIVVKPEDLRWKQFKRHAGLLIIFAVDASGSMAFNRIRQAKGALLRLLQKAYRRRDKVALISFRGNRAEVLLRPSRSVALARRALDGLPVGGGTPLAAGLRAALELVRRAGCGDAQQALLVLLTDGRANVPLAGTARGGDSVWPELETAAKALESEGVASVVIDTSQRFISGGESRALARLLGGRYAALPSQDQGAVYETVATFTDAIRNRFERRFR